MNWCGVRNKERSRLYGPDGSDIAESGQREGGSLDYEFGRTLPYNRTGLLTTVRS